MLNYFKDLFLQTEEEEQKSINDKQHKLEVAACALLVEIAKADDEFSEDEKKKVSKIIKDKFHLSESEVANIIEVSEESVNNSISLYEFTDVLNQHLNNDEKYQIVKNLWQIAYEDGNVDKYEDHYIKTISNNLHLSNKDRIAAKQEVKEKLGIK